MGMSGHSLPPRPPPAALPLSAASPKRRFVKLGRKTSDGSQQSGSTTESTVIRQPSKSRVRNHSNRLSGVFLRASSSAPGSMASSIKSSLSISTRKASTISTCPIAEDPYELSNHVTAPGVLKVFGSEICQGAHYKSVLATTQSSAKELVKEALERYGLSKEEADSYVLCDAIGSINNRQWKTEGFRVVGDCEKPLLLQSLWKPREGLARRFEIQRRSSVEEKALREKDTVTAGINAQARKLQKSRSRVTSTLAERSSSRSKLWRSKSSTDMLDCAADKSPTHQSQNSLQIFELPETGPEQRHIEERSEEGQAGDPTTEAQCEPGARGEREAGEWEREETESSGDSSTQYSIHPPHDCPYLLLLQGHSRTQDFIIYLLSSQTIAVGQTRDQSQEPKADIALFADDILPTHCQFQRNQDGGPTILRPCPNATVTRNAEPLTAEVTLCSGDIIGFGQRYLFLFKDPANPPELPKADPEVRLPAVPWLLAHAPFSPTEPFLCSTCLSMCPERSLTSPLSERAAPCFQSPDGHDLTITFPTDALEVVLKEIVVLGLNSTDRTDRPPLTVAFLLSTCVQFCASRLQASELRRLLLLTASHLQSAVWELTKVITAVQAEESECEKLQPLSLEAVISGLRPLVVWMSNSLELLHFVQTQLPVLLEWRSCEEQGHVAGAECNLILQIYLSCVRSAMEETIAVLEEVIMLAFQQCVYYITKVLYPLLPAVLDCNPFRESSDTPEPTGSTPVLDGPALGVPEEVQRIVAVLNQTWGLLQDSQLHPEISAQLIAYLFYFINASLFNSLMERGSEASFYQWSRGVHLRASLDLILDWAHETGLGDLAQEHTVKLSSAINLLATPRKTLLKTCWSSLRSLHPALHPAQLHHLLSLYTPLSHSRRVWSPSVPDRAAAQHTCDILESFDTHHPLVLPDGGFLLHLGAQVTDPGLREQLDKFKEFIQATCVSSEPQALQESRVKVVNGTPPPSPTGPLCRSLSSGGALLLSERLQTLQLQHKEEDSEPPCLLTPPNTPHTPHHPFPTDPHHPGQDKEPSPCPSTEDVHEEGFECESLCPPALRDDSSMKPLVELKEEEEDGSDFDNNNDEVFSLELERGERGIGLALLDTRDLSAKVSGLFISAVLPDSPAALCERLAPGDRILAVNGVSLLPLDYQGGKELIQASGDRVQLLVARSDWMNKALHSQN